MGRRRIYTKEFKESALEHYHSSGKSAKDVSLELGLDGSTVARWLRENKEAEEKGLAVFPAMKSLPSYVNIIYHNLKIMLSSNNRVKKIIFF
jgi:transposase